jgi:DNA modification methylase
VIDIGASGHYVGDCRALLDDLPESCVQTCVTSPPYWGLRDYGRDGQIGLEPTPDAYVAALVEVFRGVRRALRDDGTLWLNLGDSYAGGGHGAQGPTTLSGLSTNTADRRTARPGNPEKNGGASNRNGLGIVAGLKPKDLVGIPWLVAFALRADGWYLRQDIIWAKPNPMPESVTDRCTKAHEYLFLLSKSERYFYDAKAIKEASADPEGSAARYESEFGGAKARASVGQGMREFDGTRNKRSVWTVASQPYDGAHFATFPPKLIEPCILAGSRPGDLVLDPFFGSGTTGAVAEKHGRRWIGFDINDEYARLAKERTAQRSLPMG